MITEPSIRRPLALLLLLLFTVGGVAMAQAPSTVTILQGVDATTMDPHLIQAAPESNILGHIFETLVHRADDMTIQPRLAVSWEALDPLTWEFRLRDGVTFQNGEPFDAEAVKFSLERGSEEPAMSGALGAIARVDVVDDHTVDVVTETPYPLLAISLARNGHIVPPGYFQEVGEEEFNRAPIGTGPYTLEERVSGERVVLARNPDYWGGAPQLERVEFRPIQEDGARLAALQTGEVHIATNLPLSMIPRIESSDGIEAATTPGARTMLLILDARPGSPLEDARVRQALNHAIDKETLVEVLFDGRAQVLQCQQATPQYFGHNDELSAYAYDPERARELLAEAGYPDGLALDFKYPFGRYAGDKETSEAIAGMLAEVGVTANQVVLEGGEFLDQLVNLELAPMAFVGYATAPDISYQLNINLTGARYSYYANEEFDELVRSAETTLDPQERRDLYAQATRIACDDPPFVYLFAPEDLYGVADEVTGFTPRPDQAIVLDGVALQ